MRRAGSKNGQMPTAAAEGLTGGPSKFDPTRFAEEVKQRIRESREQRLKTRQDVALGRPLAAEENWERRKSYISRVKPEDPAAGAEAIQGNTTDYVDAVFLRVGMSAARTVARVLIDDGRTPYGSGFMISPKLFITNNHVLLDAEAARHARIDFNYEIDEQGGTISETVFRLDPDAFFYTVSWETLDFAVVAVGARVSGSGSLEDQGYCPLSARPDKHAKGMTVNIIEHPNGWIKKLVVRENRLVARCPQALHYEADTEPGSSGSPVFNDAWEVVALHHWGGPHLETRSVDGVDSPVTVNEGVRISSIIDDLKKYREALRSSPAQAVLLQEALSAVEQDGIAIPISRATGGAVVSESIGRQSGRDNVVTRDQGAASTNEAILVVPLEIRIRVLLPEGSGSVAPSEAASVRATENADGLSAPPAESPMAAGPEAVRIDPNYGNRRGFDADFLPGLNLQIWDLIPQSMIGAVAPLTSNDDNSKNELRYQHFSLIVNADRHFAILTATNIDGQTYIKIDRATGLPKTESAESAERWFDDPRMLIKYYVGENFYAANRPIFDRGHLTRREDVNWGNNERAIRANADTFHFSNCTPQQKKFNESRKYWQGIEQHYLEYGATLDKSRLSVLQGPVFNESLDPDYEDDAGVKVKVPLQFWKIVVRIENGSPRATGFLASQADLLSVAKPGAEALHPPDVHEFLASIDHIGEVTGLKLDMLTRYDTYAAPGGRSARGAESLKAKIKPLQSWSDVS